VEAERCMDRLAARLRRWRSEAGLTLQQLGERSGVAASTIHKIEVRKTVPTVSVLFKVAQGLDRPITDFLDDEPDPVGRTHRGDEALAQLERGLWAAPVGDPDREPRGWRVRLSAEHGPAVLHAEGDVLVVCEKGELDLALRSEAWRLEAGDVLTLRSPSPFAFEAAFARGGRMLLIGHVPASARNLLDREATPVRSDPKQALAESA